MTVNKYYKKRIQWTLNSSPRYNMADRKKSSPHMLMNFPQHLVLDAPFKSMNETHYSRAFAKFKAKPGTDEWLD